MSSFFDNFIGGMAFGMLANNPFFGGFFCYGMYPSMFGNMGYARMSVQMMPTTFANPSFPVVDFTPVGQTIWDTYTNPDSEYNKQFWKYYEEKNKKYSESTTKSETKNNESSTVSYDAKQLKEKWSKKQPQLTDEFYSKVVEISKKIKCNPEHLMAVINLETAQTFSTSEKNPHSTATGLIQFTSATAKTLGTTIDKLKSMTPVEQLEYVEKYLVIWKKDAGFNDNETLSSGELYALVFQPANAKKEVLVTAGTKEYSQNKILDVNNDKKITKTDLAKKVNEFMA